MWISKAEADILAIHAERAERYMMFYSRPEHVEIRNKKDSVNGYLRVTPT